LQGESENAKRDLSIQAGQFKAQIAKLRDEKAEAEKNLYDTEFALGDKEKELEKFREQSSK
jgi:uncharacterized protein YhbP (UPF0306 family)